MQGQKSDLEYQIFNELTKRMQAIVRGEEKEWRLNDFMNSTSDLIQLQTMKYKINIVVVLTKRTDGGSVNFHSIQVI